MWSFAIQMMLTVSSKFHFLTFKYLSIQRWRCVDIRILKKKNLKHFWTMFLFEAFFFYLNRFSNLIFRFSCTTNKMNWLKDTRVRYSVRQLFVSWPIWFEFISMATVERASVIVQPYAISHRMSQMNRLIRIAAVWLKRSAVQSQWWTWPIRVRWLTIVFGLSNHQIVIFIWKRIFWFALTHLKIWVSAWLLNEISLIKSTNWILIAIELFIGNASSVVIRDGSTSNSTMLKKYDWPQIEGPHEKFQSFVTTLSSGFYISFKGVFLPESRFAIVYTAFSYMGMNNFIRFFLA